MTLPPQQRPPPPRNSKDLRRRAVPKWAGLRGVAGRQRQGLGQHDQNAHTPARTGIQSRDAWHLFQLRNLAHGWKQATTFRSGRIASSSHQNAEPFRRPRRWRIKLFHLKSFRYFHYNVLTEFDADYCALIAAIQDGFPSRQEEWPIAIRGFWKIRNDLWTDDVLVLFNSRSVIPSSTWRLPLTSAEFEPWISSRTGA